MITRLLFKPAIAVLSLLLAACATPDPGTPAGQIVESPSRPAAGSVLTYATFNAYNNESRAIVRQSFAAQGSRIEGIDYELPSEGGFGLPRAQVVNRVLDAGGNIVRLERADGSSVTYEPALRVLPFPLRPGTRFSQQLTARESDGSPPRRVVVTGYVAGWETVTVPAGQFRALRVVRDSFLGDYAFHRTQTILKETDWYSPEAGAIVRSHQGSQFEDLNTGGDEGSADIRFGDWLRWELQSIGKAGAAG